MRIGLVGVGRIGALHAATLAGLDAVEQVVLADLDPARARAVAKELGADSLPDVDALFRAGLDGIVICAPTGAHGDLIGRALDAGLTTFCEKPLAPDLAITRMVADRATGGRAQLQMGFQRRFDPGFRAARDAVSSGRLGWIHTIRANTGDAAPPPASYIPSSGGFFRDCSIHDIDAVRFVSGREVVRVYAVGENRGDAFFAEAGDVDAAAAVLTMDDGTIALISGSRYNARGYDVRLEALGSKDSVSVGMDDKMPLSSLEEGVDFPSATPYVDFLARFHTAYVEEMAAFTDLVAGRIETPCSAHEALQAFLVAEACDLSRREGRPVNLNELGS
ncbi:MAG: Gfo/Idh/MocA family oxidoreductase [Dermatophilaceae bacterium]